MLIFCIHTYRAGLQELLKVPLPQGVGVKGFRFESGQQLGATGNARVILGLVGHSSVGGILSEDVGSVNKDDASSRVLAPSRGKGGFPTVGKAENIIFCLDEDNFVGQLKVTFLFLCLCCIGKKRGLGYVECMVIG